MWPDAAPYLVPIDEPDWPETTDAWHYPPPPPAQPLRTQGFSKKYQPKAGPIRGNILSNML